MSNNILFIIFILLNVYQYDEVSEKQPVNLQANDKDKMMDWLLELYNRTKETT